MNAVVTIPLVEQIDQHLPQTQCGKCGHPGCRPYAEAIAEGEAINKCPPGGEATMQHLAELLERAPLPLEVAAETPKVAFIREEECIGCTKCIKACPVDAILGAAKKMHTVIVSECTGCDLCVEPCPVDCIDMLPHPQWQAARDEAERQAFLDRRAAKARMRFENRNARLARLAEEKKHSRETREARRLATLAPSSRPAEQFDPKAGAAAPSATSLKAARAAATASIRRVEKKLKQARAEDRGEVAQLETQLATARQHLASIETQLSAATPTTTPTSRTTTATAAATASGTPRGKTLNQLKIAASAAEATYRKAVKQLERLERLGSAEEVAEATAQLERAEANRQSARQALDQAG